MTSDLVWSFLVGVLIIAILAVLTNPNSNAGQAIKDVTGALTSLVQAAVA